jgi:hypothetical protein
MSAPELYHDFRIGRWKIGDPEETMIRIPDEVLQCHFATSSTFQQFGWQSFLGLNAPPTQTKFPYL